jgi:cytochrome P450
LQEALRLAPPAYFIPRTTLQDDVIDGYTIPTGTVVAVTPYTIHRHPDFWPDARRFDPDRFSREHADIHHSMAWIPFGAGNRICAGRDLSYVVGTLVLAMLLQRFTLRADANFVTKPRLSVAFNPDRGVKVYLSRR